MFIEVITLQKNQFSCNFMLTYHDSGNDRFSNYQMLEISE